MTVSIRLATVDDAEELTRLRWDFRVEHGTPASRTFDEFRAEMRAFGERTLLPGSSWRAWVAEEGGRLVGCVWLRVVEKVPHPSRSVDERPIAYLTNMYVEAELRNRGIGRDLVDAAIGYARWRRVDGIVVWPSERSRSFYERAGFGADGAPMWLGVEGD